MSYYIFIQSPNLLPRLFNLATRKGSFFYVNFGKKFSLFKILLKKDYLPVKNNPNIRLVSMKTITTPVVILFNPASAPF